MQFNPMYRFVWLRCIKHFFLFSLTVELRYNFHRARCTELKWTRVTSLMTAQPLWRLVAWRDFACSWTSSNSFCSPELGFFWTVKGGSGRFWEVLVDTFRYGYNVFILLLALTMVREICVDFIHWINIYGLGFGQNPKEPLLWKRMGKAT